MKITVHFDDNTTQYFDHDTHLDGEPIFYSDSEILEAIHQAMACNVLPSQIIDDNGTEYGCKWSLEIVGV